MIEMRMRLFPGHSAARVLTARRAHCLLMKKAVTIAVYAAAAAAVAAASSAAAAAAAAAATDSLQVPACRSKLS